MAIVKREFFIRIDPEDGTSILEVLLPKTRQCFNPSCNKKYVVPENEYSKYCPECMTDSVKCVGCGKKHLKLDLYKATLYDGTTQYYCDGCYRKKIQTCPICQKHVHIDDIQKTGAASLCPTCFKDNGECEICHKLINISKSKPYKDEFHQYSVLCTNCYKVAKTYIPQNVQIIKSKTALVDDFLSKKKPLPIARYMHRITGSNDVGIRRILTKLNDSGLLTKYTVHIFGMKERSSGVYIKGIQYLGTLSLNRWDAHIHKPIHDQGKAVIELGIDRDLRDSPHLACRIIKHAISKVAKVVE